MGKTKDRIEALRLAFTLVQRAQLAIDLDGGGVPDLGPAVDSIRAEYDRLTGRKVRASKVSR